MMVCHDVLCDGCEGCQVHGPEEEHASASPCGIHVAPPCNLAGECKLCEIKIAAMISEPRYVRTAFANE
jgi:hypothetical protein